MSMSSRLMRSSCGTRSRRPCGQICATPSCSIQMRQPRCDRRQASGYIARLSSIRRLDPLHVLVAEPEMVADLVDQHVAHQVAQVFAALAPVIEDRAAIEKDHVEVRPRIADALVRQGNAPIEA